MSTSGMTVPEIDKKFGLKQKVEIQKLTELISKEKIGNFDLSDFEKQILLLYQKNLLLGYTYWNEYELREKFIGPVMTLAQFETDDFNYFSERSIYALVNNEPMNRRVDGMIAKGRKEPEIPYFFLSEYKQDSDPTGDPLAQCLIAMIIATELNQHKLPVYGATVKGSIWRFMVFHNNEYAISHAFDSTDEQLFDILKILKHLKSIVAETVKL